MLCWGEPFVEADIEKTNNLTKVRSYMYSDFIGHFNFYLAYLIFHFDFSIDQFQVQKV